MTTTALVTDETTALTATLMTDPDDATAAGALRDYYRDHDDLTAQADYLKWLIDSPGLPMGDAFREVALCAKHARELAQVAMAQEFIGRTDRQAARDLRGRIQNTVGLNPGFNARLEYVVIPGPQAPQAGTVTVTVGANWICERM